MAKFEVAVVTYYEFEADTEDIEEVKLMVEDGEMPRSHEVTDAYVSDVRKLDS